MNATLPNADRAIIDPLKLHSYLLSVAHPIGRFKAKFFRTLGYSLDSWRLLERDLRSQHLSQTARRIGETRYGVKYEIHAILKGPNGHKAEVVSIWMIMASEQIPRLVTVYPGGSE